MDCRMLCYPGCQILNILVFVFVVVSREKISVRKLSWRWVCKYMGLWEGEHFKRSLIYSFWWEGEHFWWLSLDLICSRLLKRKRSPRQQSVGVGLLQGFSFSMQDTGISSVINNLINLFDLWAILYFSQLPIGSVEPIIM